MHMRKRSRLNIDPTEDDLDAWWKGLDLQSKHAVRASGNLDRGNPNETHETEDYFLSPNFSERKQQFLRDLPKTLVKEEGFLRIVMTYDCHTKDAVFYTVTRETASDMRNPVFDENRAVRDKKVVALFYTHVGKGKSRPHPASKKSETSDRLHGLCGTNPANKHMIIQDYRNKLYYDNSCWCVKFLWEIGFSVNQKF